MRNFHQRGRPEHPAQSGEQIQRGDAAVLLIFLILTILLLGAATVGVIAVANLRTARDISASTQSLYGADTGVERALYIYLWDTVSPGNVDPSCVIPPLDNELIAGGNVDGRYRLELSGDDPPLGENAAGAPPCPSTSDVESGLRALCIQAIGKNRSGAVIRRVTADSYDLEEFTNNHPGDTDPCNRGS